MINVVVGVVENDVGEILIALRSKQQHLGGLWEFPGGKIESGEGAREALVRELMEELDIEVKDAEPLIYLEHDYGDKRVSLDVYSVRSFFGNARGREGQPIQWVPKERLGNFSFPEANRPIVAAIKLPKLVAVSPVLESFNLAHYLTAAASKGAGMYYLRKGDEEDAKSYRQKCTVASELCRKIGVMLAVNASGYSGLGQALHLKSSELLDFNRSSFPEVPLVGASCHSLDEIYAAQSVGCDYAFLSPVLDTRSHPNTLGVGFSQFGRIVKQSNLPVYALGGMSIIDAATAKEHGAQGIAALQEFLP